MRKWEGEDEGGNIIAYERR